jgi:predicted ATPase
LIFLDDIHWADLPSLEAVLRICQVCARNRLLVVCLARLRFFDDHPEWGEHGALSGLQSRRIDLLPLAPQASYQLLDHILVGTEFLSSELREAIVNHAEGNLITRRAGSIDR